MYHRLSGGMMLKVLDLNKSVYQATEQYPELIAFIAKMGYPQIRNGFLRKTMGKNFTINQAIRQMNLNKSNIISQLKEAGFEVVG